MQIAILVLCAVAVFFILYVVCLVEKLFDNIKELHGIVSDTNSELYDMKYEVKPKQVHNKKEIKDEENA